MAVVHQLLPNFEYGDAISNYAILLRRVLRRMGHRSRIYARFIHPRMWWRARPLRAARRHADRKDVVWLYHYSIGSEITRMVRDLAGPVVLVYYNITPPSLTMPGGGHLASLLDQGYEDLKTLANLPRVAVGSSEYNRAQLVEVGFRNTDILPIVLDCSAFERTPTRSIVRRYRDDHVNFLTVGRVYPHKKIEDVIRVFYYYHDYINPLSRLFVVGDPKGMEDYQRRLVELCRNLNLSNVHFTGKVRFRDLLAYYRVAGAYLCMSEHEGFCVPLLECMYLGVPVIAFKCTAVGETMGDAGILVRQKRFDAIAETAHLLTTDKALRSRVVERQKERARFFREDYLTAQLSRILAAAQSVS